MKPTPSCSHPKKDVLSWLGIYEFVSFVHRCRLPLIIIVVIFHRPSSTENSLDSGRGLSLVLFFLEIATLYWIAELLTKTSCREKPIDISSCRIYNLLELVELASVVIESRKNEFHK